MATAPTRWHAEVLVYSTDADSLATLRNMPGILAAEQITNEGLNVTLEGSDDWDATYDALLWVVRGAYGSLTEVSDLQLAEDEDEELDSNADAKAADYRAALRSYKQITGLAMGEQVCADHGGDVRIPIKPHMGVCYACAVQHGEPRR